MGIWYPYFTGSIDVIGCNVSFIKRVFPKNQKKRIFISIDNVSNPFNTSVSMRILSLLLISAVVTILCPSALLFILPGEVG